MIEPSSSHRSIQEFWIDFLLEEEFRSDPDFARTFSTAVGMKDSGAIVTKVTHSLKDVHGEADLAVELTADNGQRTALLIENKINAAFQPQQAQRYRARGETGVENGLWTAYRTVLVAPARYVQPGHGFDAAVTLEQIGDWICADQPLRRTFKRERLQRAIDKKNATGVQIVDPTMTTFRAWYGSQMEHRDAGFIPPVPHPAYHDDNWMEWISTQLPSWCRFRHRTRSGVLDLSFIGITNAALDTLKSELPVTARLTAIGKASRGAITIDVPAISDFADLSAAAPIVELTLNIAESLQNIACAHLATLEMLRAHDV